MTVTILGVDLELDLYDVDVYEKYEEEVRRVSRRVNDPQKAQGQTTAQKLKYQCSVVKDFFDAVFGQGTSEKLFHGKNNIKDCNEAYLAVIEASGTMMTDLTDTFTSKYAELSAKYSPEEDKNTIAFRNAASAQNLNRAQRRSSGKKKH